MARAGAALAIEPDRVDDVVWVASVGVVAGY
jgi:hypothetical protein